MHNSLLLKAHGDVFNGVSLHPYFVYERSEDSVSSVVIHALKIKKTQALAQIARREESHES